MKTDRENKMQMTKWITIMVGVVAIVVGVTAGLLVGNARNKAKEQAAAEAFLAEVEALMQSGKDAYHGTDTVTKDFTKASEHFTQALEKGDVRASYYLGRIAEESKDYAKAKEHYEQSIAAETDTASDLSRFALGQLYQYGNGVDVDYAKAKEYYEQAIANGCVEANNGLGDLYQHGYEVEQDGAKAIEYFTLASQGNEKDWVAYAHLSAGVIYAGEYPNVTQDYAKAMENYEKAAALDNASAMNRIGVLYGEGKGVEQDSNKAREYYEQAAEQNNSDAMQNIGYYYHKGLGGLEQDYAKALEWYRLAAQANYPGAAEAVSRLENRKSMF